MSDPLLPYSIPVATGALIAGLSAATFRLRCIETGAVQMEAGRIVLTSLAAHLGRRITAADYLRADRVRERQSARARRGQRREGLVPRPGLQGLRN